MLWSSRPQKIMGGRDSANEEGRETSKIKNLEKHLVLDLKIVN